LTITHGGESKEKKLLNMGLATITNVYDDSDQLIHKKGHQRLKKKEDEIAPYYFREYLGTYQMDGTSSQAFQLKYQSKTDVRIHKIELQYENRLSHTMEDLLLGGIGFYTQGFDGSALPTCVYNAKQNERAQIASCAASGVALMAFCIQYELTGDVTIPEKVLKLLRIFNHKHPKIKPDRHHSGFFRHFINVHNGKGRSEFSTIDTSILISGALMARNTFDDSKIRDEADELWNSVDWSKAVVSTDPSMPKFFLKGTQLDGEEKGTISMYNEYILLAYFCQKYEDGKMGDRARKHIMPDLFQLPRSVFRGRIILAQYFQPSFLVQFPFYMSELCRDELFFSFVAAQGVADRSVGIDRYGDRSFWGVSPGTTPEKGYHVDHFMRNEARVVRPRMLAGFIPVMPQAAEDLFLLHQDPKRHWDLDFGTILPGFVPGDDEWRAWRLPGIDFSSLLLGMAAHHHKVGLKFFKEKMIFTFETR
jgi:hypothetical protein